MVARNKPQSQLRRRRGRPRFFTRKRVCSFCVEHVSHIDYKDIPRLRRYISERSRMDPRRKTGTCARHQRGLSVAIKRARHVALIPFTQGQPRTAGDS